MKLHVALIRDRLNTPCQLALRNAFARRFNFVDVHCGNGLISSATEIPHYKELDAVVWFVCSDDLCVAPPFDWADCTAIRLQFETDAVQVYDPIAWGLDFTNYRAKHIRHGFHAMISTGKRVTDLLCNDGVPTFWIPKGYDADNIAEQDGPRDGICSYGAPYPARRAVLRHLTNAGIEVRGFKCPYSELSGTLNQFLGCIICNMSLRGAKYLSGRRSLLYRLPLFPNILRQGLEAMAKNFEVAAAGCAPICDFNPELTDHGFADGETMIAYTGYGDLVEKLSRYLDQPELLREIGRRAARLVRSRHTWDHRAEDFDALIRDLASKGAHAAECNRRI